jgi:hypothetical protein
VTQATLWWETLAEVRQVLTGLALEVLRDMVSRPAVPKSNWSSSSGRLCCQTDSGS